MKLPILLLALPLAFGFTACASTSNAESKSAESAEDAGGDEDAQDEAAAADRAVQDARIELKIAQAEAESTARKMQDEVEAAENAAKIASDALDHFLKSERDLELSKVQFGLDRASWGLEAERQELAELEAMYKKDDVAALTKELVLQRGKKGVEFAERELAHEQREASAKRDFELPRKQRELEVEKREKENALREARAARDRSVDEVELALRKAKAELEDAEKAAKKARAKTEKAAKA